MPERKRRQRHNGSFRWAGLTDTELLEWRFRDLGLQADNEILCADVEHLYQGLERRGIRFKPHIWISTDWFSPDGIPGIAVPFFAAHPRLAQLEQRQKQEAEGGNRRWRRRILRHEAGHALDTAYGLRRRADWRAIFGRASKRYPSAYAARPASRRFVQHLGHWYAQSHPTEDFAETFAVWLQPKARWRRDYADWPALEKLEYVDALMAGIAGRRPKNSNRSIVAPLSSNRRTLKEHYRRQQHTENRAEKRYDGWLLRAFVTRARRPDALAAGRFLATQDKRIRAAVLQRTGTGPYLFDEVAQAVRRRCRILDLAVRGTQREALKTAVRLHQRIIADLLRRNSESFVL